MIKTSLYGGEIYVVYNIILEVELLSSHAEVQVQVQDLPLVYDKLIINDFLISYLVHTCCSLGGPWNLSVSDRYLLVPVR